MNVKQHIIELYEQGLTVPQIHQEMQKEAAVHMLMNTGIKDTFFPMLKQAGIEPDQIDTGALAAVLMDMPELKLAYQIRQLSK